MSNHDWIARLSDKTGVMWLCTRCKWTAFTTSTDVRPEDRPCIIESKPDYVCPDRRPGDPGYVPSSERHLFVGSGASKDPVHCSICGVLYGYSTESRTWHTSTCPGDGTTNPTLGSDAPSKPYMAWSFDGRRVFTGKDGCRFEVVLISLNPIRWGFTPMDPAVRTELNLAMGEYEEVDRLLPLFMLPPGHNDVSELSTPFTSDGNRKPEPEGVNHPSYYAPGIYEVFRVLIAWGFHTDSMLWDAIIYIARSKKKGDELKDLKKAQFWLARKIEYLEGVDHTNTSAINQQLGHTTLEDDPQPQRRTTPEILEAARLEGYAQALDDLFGAAGPVLNIRTAFEAPYVLRGTPYVIHTELLERLAHLRTMKGIPTK